MVDQKKIQEVLHIVTTKVDEVLGKFPQIDAPVTTLADKVKVPKAYVALGLLLVPFFLLLAMGSGDFAVDMIGFVYPVYASIKAIEGNDKEEDSTWLTYWLVFAMFKTLEGVANRILNMIPYYFFIKCAFLIWCYHPKTHGAKIVYLQLVKPHIVPLLHEEPTSKKDN